MTKQPGVEDVLEVGKLQNEMSHLSEHQKVSDQTVKDLTDKQNTLELEAGRNNESVKQGFANISNQLAFLTKQHDEDKKARQEDAKVLSDTMSKIVEAIPDRHELDAKLDSMDSSAKDTRDRHFKEAEANKLAIQELEHKQELEKVEFEGKLALETQARKFAVTTLESAMNDKVSAVKEDIDNKDTLVSKSIDEHKLASKNEFEKIHKQLATFNKLRWGVYGVFVLFTAVPVIFLILAFLKGWFRSTP